jgi:hypothetical protein
MKILFWILGDNTSLSFLSKSRFQKSVLSAASRPLLFSVEHASHCTKNITPFAMYEFITAELFKIPEILSLWIIVVTDVPKDDGTLKTSVTLLIDMTYYACLLQLHLSARYEQQFYVESFIFSCSRFSYLSRNETLTEAFRSVFRSSQVICCNKFETLHLYFSLCTVRWLSSHIKVSAFPVSSQE